MKWQRPLSISDPPAASSIVRRGARRTAPLGLDGSRPGRARRIGGGRGGGLSCATGAGWSPPRPRRGPTTRRRSRCRWRTPSSCSASPRELRSTTSFAPRTRSSPPARTTRRPWRRLVNRAHPTLSFAFRLNFELGFWFWWVWVLFCGVFGLEFVCFDMGFGSSISNCTCHYRWCLNSVWCNVKIQMDSLFQDKKFYVGLWVCNVWRFF